MAIRNYDDAFITYLEGVEGASTKVYYDKIGRCWTGYCGITKGVTKDTVHTLEEWREILKEHLEEFVTNLNKWCDDYAIEYPTQNSFNATLSLVWNVGVAEAFQKYKAKKSGTFMYCCIHKDWAGAGDAMLTFCKGRDPQTGKLITIQGLLNRRKKDRELFLTGLTQ